MMDELNEQVGDSTLYPGDVHDIVDFMMLAQGEEKDDIGQSSDPDEKTQISEVSNSYHYIYTHI